jgi:hypothetical protein
MTEADRTKLVILPHQFTPAERLSAMEIATVLEFIEGRGFTITKDDNQLPSRPTSEITRR